MLYLSHCNELWCSKSNNSNGRPKKVISTQRTQKFPLRAHLPALHFRKQQRVDDVKSVREGGLSSFGTTSHRTRGRVFQFTLPEGESTSRCEILWGPHCIARLVNPHGNLTPHMYDRMETLSCLNHRAPLLGSAVFVCEAS